LQGQQGQKPFNGTGFPLHYRLVKIGRTSYEEANTRIAQLYSTGVPFPFKLEFACKVENPDEVEQALHLAFGPGRVNPRREFFSIEPEQAIAILKLLHVPDATSEVEHAPSPIGAQEVDAGNQFAARRRPNLNFEEMGIPIGSQLLFTESDASVLVSTPKKVKLNDVDMSLTAATRTLLRLDYSVQPGPYWTFNGRSVRDIYNETYPLT
jgi:hypothetical protein